MALKGNRSKRRRPRKGFPHRVVGYLDRETHEMVVKAVDCASENISAFVARAVKDRADAILKAHKRK